MCHGCAYRTYHFRNESLVFGHDSVYRLVTIEDSFRSNRFNPLESCLVPICGRGRSGLGCACLVCFSYFYFYDWSKSEASYKLDFYCGIQMISPPLHCRFAALPALRLQSTTPKISAKSVNALKTMGLPWKQSEVKAVTALTSTLPHCQPCVFNRGLLKFVSKFDLWQGMCLFVVLACTSQY